MHRPRYALVGYVKGPAGEFVENLRRELHPDLPQFDAHLTILPPRLLQVSESAAIQAIESVCGEAEPFEVHLGGVETFIPVTPTVYIRVDGQAGRMSDLHSRLNSEALPYNEEWPYIPHMTIAKMSSEELAQDAFHVSRNRWAEYAGTRRVQLENLTFVREDQPSCWVDLAPVRLGRRLVTR